MSEPALVALLPLLLTVLVVVRFAVRELRQRTVKTPAIWIRPAILGVLSAFLIVTTFGTDARDDTMTIVAVLIGAALGAVTGIAVLRYTTFASAPVPRAVLVQGSRVTLAIWVGALAIRVAARYVYAGGADPRAQLPLNCGTVVLVTVAFVILAAAFQREIAKRSTPV